MAEADGCSLASRTPKLWMKADNRHFPAISGPRLLETLCDLGLAHLAKYDESGSSFEGACGGEAA